MSRIDRKRSGVSTVIAAVLLVVGLVVGAGIGYAATSIRTTTTSTSASTLSGTVSIGVLDDLSDGLSGEGIKINFTVHQAITDINNYLNNTSWAGKVTFKVIVDDYALDSTTAQTDLQNFHSSGVSVVVGPLNSGAAQQILPTADSDQVVLISPSSTSAALAIPNDYLFRTAPTDVHQGQADARMMYQDGVRYLIQIFRDDTYGSGLANYTKADFMSDGGTQVQQIPYDISTNAYSSYLATLNTDWNSAVSACGSACSTSNNTIAIQLIAFDEGATLLYQASQDYPKLLHTQQPWYGTDGIEGETVFTNSTIASTIQAVRLPSTVFGFTNSSKTQALCALLLSATHQTCDSYPIGAYDDMWIAALSLLDCGANSGSCVQKVITSVADNYYGVSGWTTLDANGDRAASDYLVYCVTGTPLTWTVCGSWDYQTDSVTWTSGNQTNGY